MISPFFKKKDSTDKQLKPNMVQKVQLSEDQGEEIEDNIAGETMVIEEREKNVLELEHKLIEKNLKVDQVMEDYRELQSALGTEIDDLKSTIDLEQQKYVSLVQKHNEAHAEKLKKMNELEDKISRIEVENAHLRQKYDPCRKLTRIRISSCRLSPLFALYR